MTPVPVGRGAFLLGVAGLLPPIIGVALVLMGRSDPTDLSWIPLLVGYGLALVYGGIILSFLGGIWWGFAMRRDAGQAPLAALAVLPSLVALVCLGWAGLSFQDGGPLPAVALGVAILLTLPIDRHLVATGEAPANWMWLRIPLSVGLGGLLILVAALMPAR